MLELRSRCWRRFRSAIPSRRGRGDVGATDLEGQSRHRRVQDRVKNQNGEVVIAYKRPCWPVAAEWFTRVQPLLVAEVGYIGWRSSLGA